MSKTVLQIQASWKQDAVGMRTLLHIASGWANACSETSLWARSHNEKKIPLWWLPRRLVQTYCREDHRVRRHAGYFAREFDRTFVDDGQQYAEFCNFASTQSVNLFREYIKPCHRADVWRYLHMYRRGGVCLDFKCGLLQPLWRWLLELENACVQHELGRQGEARAGAQCPPFMVTSLGTFNHEYVFQGLIICSPRTPLLARVLGEAMVTRQSELASKAKGKGYLTFCRQFYQTLKKGARLNKLEPGWVDAGQQDATGQQVACVTSVTLNCIRFGPDVFQNLS